MMRMSSAIGIYTLTHTDVQEYLDAKAEQDIIGRVCDCGRCLVAEAFRAKYRETSDIMVGPDMISWHLPLDLHLHSIPVPEEILAIIEAFDVCGAIGQPITKRTWQLRMRMEDNKI